MFTVSYLVNYNTLLQNATDIFANRDSVLLQNETNFYYKLSVYYKSIVILRGPSRFDGHKFSQFDGQ